MAIDADEKCNWGDELLQKVYRFALGLTKNKQDAEDLTVETWLRLERRAAAPQGSVENQLAYAIKTATNLWIDICRRERRKADGQESGRMQLSAALQVDPDAEAIAEEEAERMEIARDHLPERPREVFRLVRHEGLTFVAVAAKLGISVSTAKRALREALVALAAARTDEGVGK